MNKCDFSSSGHIRTSVPTISTQLACQFFENSEVPVGEQVVKVPFSSGPGRKIARAKNRPLPAYRHVFKRNIQESRTMKHHPAWATNEPHRSVRRARKEPMLESRYGRPAGLWGAFRCIAASTSATITTEEAKNFIRCARERRFICFTIWAIKPCR